MAYIALAANERILCWYAAMIGNVLFIVLFLDASLYTKVLLRAYYLVMAFYGVYQWKRGSFHGKKGLPIRTLPLSYHLIAILGCLGIGLGTGLYLESATDAAMPYLDATTTVFSLFTTWMVARKYLENWLYWIAIDGASIYLYASQGLGQTALLYGVFTAMAIWGVFNWRRHYRQQQNEKESLAEAS